MNWIEYLKYIEINMNNIYRKNFMTIYGKYIGYNIRITFQIDIKEESYSIIIYYESYSYYS